MCRLCTGLFFTFGSCYFFNSIAISRKFLNVYKTNITPAQVGILAVLAISVLFFLLFFQLPKITLLPFLGIVLFLFGISSLYYSDILLSYQLISGLLYPESGESGDGAFIFKVTHLFLFILFWSLAAKINRLDSRFYKNQVSLWFDTLLLNCIASFLLLLYGGSGPDFFDLIMRLGVYSILNPVSLLYGVFLWFNIKAICIFSEEALLGMQDKLLDKWLSAVFTLLALLLLYDVRLSLFLLKVAAIATGLYFFWKQKLVLVRRFTLSGGKRIVKFFVSSLLVAPVLAWSVLSFLDSLKLISGRVFLDFLDLIIETIPFVLKVLPSFVIWVLIPPLDFFINGTVFLKHNFFVSCFLLACILTIYFYRYYTFENSMGLLLKYAFGCFISLMAIAFFMQYEFRFIRNPSESLPWLKTFLAENESWIVYIKTFLLLSIVGFSFQQGIKKGSRLLLWTIGSNLLLYHSLSEAVYYGLLVNIGADVLHLFNSGDIAPVRFIIYVLLNAVPLLILLLLLLASCNSNIEEKVLPSLLRCRAPGGLEKLKMDEATAILYEKGLWSGTMPIQIYISQIAEMNAYTIGKKTIAITYPLFHKLSSQQIAGIISHELGHIQSSDGRLQVFLYILNLPSILIQKTFKLFSFRHTPMITTLGCLLLFFLAYTNSLTLAGTSAIGGVMVWFLLQMAIFLMKNQDLQDSEWKADEYASSKGLGQELKEALMLVATVDETNDDNDREPWMEKYPDLAERIQRLETLQNPIGV